MGGSKEHNSGQNLPSREAEKGKVTPSNTILTRAHPVGSNSEPEGREAPALPPVLAVAPQCGTATPGMDLLRAVGVSVSSIP